MSQTPCTVILHIPKTAGTSFRHAALSNYSPPEVFLHYPNERSYNSLGRLWSLGTERVSKYRLMMGHFGMPAEHFAPGPYRVVTMLRNPRARVVSAFKALQRHQKKKNIDISGTDFAAYLKAECPRSIDNVFCRYLSGRNPDWLQCDAELLDAALRNLERLAAVGISERFNDSVSLISDVLGWRNRLLVTANESKNKDVVLDDESEALIEQLTRFDQQLYSAAMMRFESDIAARGRHLAGGSGGSAGFPQKLMRLLRRPFNVRRTIRSGAYSYARAQRDANPEPPFCSWTLDSGILRGHLSSQATGRNVQLFSGTDLLGTAVVSEGGGFSVAARTLAPQQSYLVLRDEQHSVIAVTPVAASTG